MVQHIYKSLNKLMFDTYQQVALSFKPNTVHCIKSWCQSVVAIYVENMSSQSKHLSPVNSLYDGH